MDTPKILYKFRKIDKYGIDILVNNRLFLANWEKLNDPHEVRVCVKKPHENMNFNMHPAKLKDWGVPVECSEAFVCSLSKIWHSNLLWSHYAASHTGIAIGIDISFLPPNIESIEVVYNDETPILKPPVTKSTIKNSLKYKSREWIYEEEVRLVSFDTSSQYLENITIKEVLFGMNTSNEDKYLITNILRENTVDFFDVRTTAGKYSLSRSDGARERLFKLHPKK